MQALYQQQMEGTALAKLLNEFHQYRLGRVIEDEEYAEADVDFFDDIVAGVDARRAEIDDKLTGRLADGWTLARLDKTMLQILRAGAYELLARPDVPKASAISEYVDVAKAFFDDREAKFVNGILDAIAKEAGR
ncbi:transcription antitermination factor NusB [Erythrobacter sp. HI0037]|nr:transcription antitermination factor NusB [Erythrobacter sp. HI0037]